MEMRLDNPCDRVLPVLGLLMDDWPACLDGGLTVTSGV